MEGRRIRNTGAVDFGRRSMDTGRRPLCGCFVLSCRRDKVPARNTDRQSGFAFTHLKKFLRVPRGGFSKTLLGREWDSVPQRKGEPIWPGAPFQAGQGPFTKRPQTVRLRLYEPERSFWEFQGAFFQKRALGREWDGVPQRSVRLFFYFLDCTDFFVYNLVPSTLKRKSFFRSLTSLLFRTFCFPSRRAFGSSVA